MIQLVKRVSHILVLGLVAGLVLTLGACGSSSSKKPDSAYVAHVDNGKVLSSPQDHDTYDGSLRFTIPARWQVIGHSWPQVAAFLGPDNKFSVSVTLVRDSAAKSSREWAEVAKSNHNYLDFSSEGSVMVLGEEIELWKASVDVNAELPSSAAKLRKDTVSLTVPVILDDELLEITMSTTVDEYEEAKPKFLALVESAHLLDPALKDHDSKLKNKETTDQRSEKSENK